MVKIFVSYSHDDEAVAQSIVGYLHKAYDDVWYDEKLHTGDAWWDRIVGKIENCTHFIFLMSNESLKSDYCRKELSFAREKGKIILPIKVRRSVDLPDDLKYLDALQICEMLGKVTIDSLNELYAALIRKSDGIEPLNKLTEQHRQADLRQIAQFWNYLPENFINRNLGYEVEQGRIRESDYQAIHRYAKLMNSTHYRFFNTKIQSSFEDFHEMIERAAIDEFTSHDDSGEYLVNSIWHWMQDPDDDLFPKDIMEQEVGFKSWVLQELSKSYKSLILCIKQEYPEFDFPIE